MKIQLLLHIVGTIICFSLKSNAQDTKFTYDLKIHDVDTIVVGDINHDKVIDTAFIVRPKWIEEKEDWIDPLLSPYNVKIHFSFGTSFIEVGNAVTAFVESIGDIDEDGFDEIVVAPGWIISCCKTFIFTDKMHNNGHI